MNFLKKLFKKKEKPKITLEEKNMQKLKETINVPRWAEGFEEDYYMFKNRGMNRQQMRGAIRELRKLQ